MRDLDDSEMNDLIIKFVVASVIKKNYDMALSDISNLRGQYEQYDLNFYIFLLRLIKGDFSTSLETAMNIKQNIYYNAWAIVSEADFAFYSSLSLLVCFKRSTLKEIPSLSNYMINKSFEDYPANVEILENYSKCKYDIIAKQFEEMKPRIKSDPIISSNLTKINFEVKNNMLREILKISSKVSIDYLSSVLREEDKVKLENWILLGISDGYLRVKIDDIEKVVYSSEISLKNSIIEKARNLAMRTYDHSVMKILQNVGNDKLDLKNKDVSNMRKYVVERARGMGDYGYED